MSKTAIVASIHNKMRLKIWPALVGALLLAGCATGTVNLRADNGGHLAQCDSGPHCVSSEASNKDHHVAPLTYTDSRALARQRLEQVIRSMKGARIVKQTPGYIHATYTSEIFGFVDDVEFVLPEGSHEIQVRSSSRIGYYDFGVNRARVKTIRKRFEAAVG